MNLTQQERKVIAKAFCEAKKYLWDGTGKRTNKHCVHICSALRDVGLFSKYLYHDAATARYLIMNRLYPYTSVEGFLYHKHRVFKLSPSVKTQIQQYRHAWLDELIKEFSS